MKIIPNRTMRLGGQHLERGVVANVSADDGATALRHGWAVAAPVKPSRDEQKPAAAPQAAAGPAAE